MWRQKMGSRFSSSGLHKKDDHNLKVCGENPAGTKTGAYPDTALGYPQVLVSKGPLPAAQDAVATADAEGNIYFNWADNTGSGTAKADDKVILVAYFPALQQIVFSLDAGHREDGTATLRANNFAGYDAETWIAL